MTIKLVTIYCVIEVSKYDIYYLVLRIKVLKVRKAKERRTKILTWICELFVCLLVCLLACLLGLFTYSDVEDELNRIEQETTELKLKTEKRKQNTDKSEVNNILCLLLLLFTFYL